MQRDMQPKDLRNEGYRIRYPESGQFLISICAAYHVGDGHKFGSPRIEIEARDGCVTFFLDQARKQFSLPLAGSVVTERQRTIQTQMLVQLETELFGLREPDPENEP